MGEMIDKAKGNVKVAVGKATGDKSLENEGRADKVKGAIKGGFEDVKHAVKEAGRDIKNANADDDNKKT